MALWKWKSSQANQLTLEGTPDRVRHGVVGRSAVEVGRFSYGLETATIRQWGEGATLRLGAYCSVADGLTIFLGGNHRTDWATTFPFGHVFRDYLGGEEIVGHPISRGDIVIGNDVWIGANVTLLSGVRIEDGAVIAATSTVTRSVGPYEVWGGNPAKLLRPRFSEDITWRLHALRWWDCGQGTIRELMPLLSVPPDNDILDRLEEIVARDPSRDRVKKEGPV
jgi:chloramphenicol O-acetyltransferase type B